MISFYGGRKGRDFDIVASYISQEDMAAAFSSIEYGKYVILTYTDRDEQQQVIQENKLYKRGLSDWEWVADLVLPADNGEKDRPYMELGNYSTIHDFIEEHSSDPGFVYTEGTFTTDDLVPGEPGQSTLPSIGYSSYIDNLGVGHLGFQLPIPVVDIVGTRPGTVTQIENTALYKKWSLNIPDVATTSVTHLRVYNLADRPSSMHIYVPADGSTAEHEMDYSPTRVILIYDYTNSSNVTKTYYCGDYNSISNITLVDGTLTITDLNGSTYTATNLRGISAVTYSDGNFTITYTDNTLDTLSVKLPETIEYDSTTGNVNVEYTDDTSDVLYAPNFVEATRIADDKHLYVYYSNPQYRESQHADENGWVDLGLISLQTGLLVGKNFTPDEIIAAKGSAAKENVIAFLTERYPNGIDSRGEQQKNYVTDRNGNYLLDARDGSRLMTITYSSYDRGTVATVGETYEAKEFYAFDYTSRLGGWYYLGRIEDATSATLKPVVIATINEEDPDQETTIAQQLEVGGIWLGVE